MDSVVATKAKVKHPDEDLGYSMDFTAGLGPGETIASVTSVDADPDGDLTIGAGSPTTGTILDDDGKQIAAGCAISFHVAGGVDKQDYWLTAIVVTQFADDTSGNTRAGVSILHVRSK